MKTNRLLNIIGGVLVAASSIFYVGGCYSEEEKAQARIRQWNAWVTEENAKRQAQSQNNYQTSPQQNNLEKNAEKAITHGVGEFIGEALIYEYLKK